jgi:hypothetical protein
MNNEATLAVIEALEACGIPYMLVSCEIHGTRALLDEIRQSIPTI